MNICIECRRVMRLWFLFAIIFYIVTVGYDIPPSLLLLIAAVPVFSSFGLWASVTEIFFLFIPIAVFYFLTDNLYALYLPALTYILLIMSVRSGRLWVFAVSFLYVIFWSYISFIFRSSYIDIFLIIVSLLNLFLNISLLCGNTEKTSSFSVVSDIDKDKDIIISAIQDGLKETGAVISKDNEYDGGGLLAVFNVRNFIPDIDFLKSLYISLPRGKGRRAFIIYGSLFYPDCAYLFVWLILVLKGYAVMGRAAYIDSLTYVKAANIGYAAKDEMIKLIRVSAGDVAEGWRSGMPPLLPMFPVSFIAFIVKIVFVSVGMLIRGTRA